MRPAREHAHAEVRRKHCAWNRCAAPPRIEYLGEGCYRADRKVYDCTTDVLPAGALFCLESPPDGIELRAKIPRSVREIHVVNLEPMAPEVFFPLPPLVVRASNRCRERLPPEPPQCKPSQLAFSGDAGALGLPDPPPALQIPAELQGTTMRSGKSWARLELRLCTDDAGATATTVLYRSPDPGLDAYLQRWLLEEATPPPPGTCLQVELRAHVDCIYL